MDIEWNDESEQSSASSEHVEPVTAPSRRPPARYRLIIEAFT